LWGKGATKEFFREGRAYIEKTFKTHKKLASIHFCYVFASRKKTFQGESNPHLRYGLAKECYSFLLVCENIRARVSVNNYSVVTMVKNGSEAWVLRKTDENTLDVFQRNYLRVVQGTRLTNRISNSGLHEKCGPIPLSRDIMKERLRWLGHDLRMKDDRLTKIVLFGQPSGAKWKVGLPRLG